MPEDVKGINNTQPYQCELEPTAGCLRMETVLIIRTVMAGKTRRIVTELRTTNSKK